MFVKYGPYEFEDSCGFEQGIKRQILSSETEKDLEIFGRVSKDVVSISFHNWKAEKKMPNVDSNSQFRPLFFKWCTHKKSLQAFPKYAGLSRMSNVILISHSHERHGATTFACGWNVRWSTTLCCKLPKLTTLSNTFIPQDVSENSFYFITKADIKSVKKFT